MNTQRSNINRRPANTQHHAFKHGMCYTRFYRIWAGMITRCHNTKDQTYQRYGERGIKVCDEWREDFRNFKKDMEDSYSDGLQIDRIDNSKGYSKENCRWVNLKQQARNKSNVKFYHYKGKTGTLGDFAEMIGEQRHFLLNRIRKGVSFNEAIETPKRVYKDAGIRKKHNKWYARINRGGREYYVGCFKTKKEAIKARNKLLKEYENNKV